MDVRLARAYFVVQASVGAVWWVAVYASEDVRRWTLGDWNPDVLVAPDLVLFVGASAVAGIAASRTAAVVCAIWTTLITLGLSGYALVERQAGWGAVLMVSSAAATIASALTLWFGRLPVQWFFVGPFAFRVTEDRARRTHLRRSLTQLVGFWTSFLVLLPLALSWLERRLRMDWKTLGGDSWHWAGGAIFVAASAVGLWSCLAMAIRGEGTPLPAATAQKLVAIGPYRVVRNPMAVAGALQTIGAGLWFGSWLAIASAFAGAVIWNYGIRPSEEADLLARFGDDYRVYCAAVRCWIPVRA